MKWHHVSSNIDSQIDFDLLSLEGSKSSVWSYFGSLNFLSQGERNVIIHTVQEELVSDLDKGCATTNTNSTESSLKKPEKG